MQVLIDLTPESAKRYFGNGLLIGPQIKPASSKDARAEQKQVDNLLDGLGF